MDLKWFLLHRNPDVTVIALWVKARLLPVMNLSVCTYTIAMLSVSPKPYRIYGIMHRKCKLI